MNALIKVLILGEPWGHLDQAFASLTNRRVAEFFGPDAQEILEAVVQTNPSAIMVSAGSESIVQALLNTSASEQPLLPPVLLCVDHKSLETEGLYDYADDFLVVPCCATEIEKRLSRLVSRSQNGLPDHLLRLGSITLDTRIYEVRIDGTRVELAFMEFQLLRFLMENPGQIFTREELLASVWSVDSFGGTRTVDVHIRRLRQKLGLRGNSYIRTVSNVGYGLVDV